MLRTDEEASAARPPRARWAQFARLAAGFWRGDKRGQAWLLTLLVVLCVALQLAAQLGVNLWNRSFFDALEHKKNIDLLTNVALLPFLTLFCGLTASATLIARMSLQLRWREWLTRRLAGWWIEDQRYYRLGIVASEQSAPEYRIAEDVRLSIEPLVDFAIGVLTALAMACAFFGVLWSVGGSASFSIGGVFIVIPAYLGLACIVYTLLSGGLAYVTGRYMVRAVAQKNEAEAQFRAELTRLRENAESIALVRGDSEERRSIFANFEQVVKAWIYLIRQNGIVASVQNSNGAFVPLAPLVLVAPKYLSDQISLGGVMQLASAFVTVQIALNWFIDNFVRVAEWMASANRVDELSEALDGLDVSVVMGENESIEISESEDNQIRIEDLSVAHRNGRVVIADANVEIALGEKVLIGGESGSGKSTLIRALAGLWPWGSGKIKLPKDATIAFVPQKPYVPLGTLRTALLYSAPADAEITDDMIAGAMQRCGLSYLLHHLDDEERWDQILSGGERQRLAFARLLLQRPQIIIMDEATSALDEESQSSLLSLLNEDLAHATVISVGHRTGLEDFHDKTLYLQRRPAGANVVARKSQKSLWHLFENGLLGSRE